MNDFFDSAGNVVDPTIFAGNVYDGQGNLFLSAIPSAASTYTAASAPSTTPAWLNSLISAAPSLAQSGASIYASATAGKNQPKLPPLAKVAPSVQPVKSGISMTTILILAVVAVLGLVLIVPRLIGKK